MTQAFDAGRSEQKTEKTLPRHERGHHGTSPASTKPLSDHASKNLKSLSIKFLFNYPEKSTTNSATVWLDGLRGVAAAEVVLHHYHLHFLGPAYNYAYGSIPDMYQWYRLPLVRNYWHSAHAMVNVFFIISGFVLTHRSLSLIRSKKQDQVYTGLSSSIFRRLVRIFLPVIPVTFFGMLMVRVGLKPSGSGLLPIEYHASFLGQVLDWYGATEKFFNPFHNYHDQWDIVHPYEHVMWTLPLEYYGSLVCYATVLGVAQVTNFWKRNLIVCVIIYLALKRINWWSANFLAGTLLADVVLMQAESTSQPKSIRTTKFGMSWQQVFWSFVLLWSFYLCGLPDPHPDQYGLPGYNIYVAWTPHAFLGIEGGGRFWWMIAGIGFTVSISQLQYARSLFELRFCKYLGKISFMLYLIHTYVFELFGKPWLNYLQSTFATMTYHEGYQQEVLIAGTAGQTAIYIGFWIVMFPILAICSGVTTRYIDQPSIRAARAIESFFIAAT